MAKSMPSSLDITERTGAIRSLSGPGCFAGAVEFFAINASAVHLPVCVGSLREAGIATAALLHLAASLPNLDLACNLGGPALFLEGDLIAPMSIPDNGMMPVPSGPGLGVDVDEERLAFYAANAE